MPAPPRKSVGTGAEEQVIQSMDGKVSMKNWNWKTLNHTSNSRRMTPNQKSRAGMEYEFILPPHSDFKDIQIKIVQFLLIAENAHE